MGSLSSLHRTHGIWRTWSPASSTLIRICTRIPTSTLLGIFLRMDHPLYSSSGNGAGGPHKELKRGKKWGGGMLVPYIAASWSLSLVLKLMFSQLVEYDQRAHKLSTLAQFSCWVQCEHHDYAHMFWSQCLYFTQIHRGLGHRRLV